MSEVTQLLDAAASGDSNAARELLPLVYDQLRKLAEQRLAHEKPGQTLQATALVHEAYLRLVASAEGSGDTIRFDHRGHFFAAAAEAMRRILVDKARRKRSVRHGGAVKRTAEFPDELPAPQAHEPLELLAIHDALDRLAAKSPRKAELVKLRYFLGCTIPEAAELLGIAPATAEDDWTFAKAWLRLHLNPTDENNG
jgi:RNA polymerase sigma factor (TIGR02999 family)